MGMVMVMGEETIAGRCLYFPCELVELVPLDITSASLVTMSTANRVRALRVKACRGETISEHGDNMADSTTEESDMGNTAAGRVPIEGHEPM